MKVTALMLPLKLLTLHRAGKRRACKILGHHECDGCTCSRQHWFLLCTLMTACMHMLSYLPTHACIPETCAQTCIVALPWASLSGTPAAMAGHHLSFRKAWYAACDSTCPSLTLAGRLGLGAGLAGKAGNSASDKTPAIDDATSNSCSTVTVQVQVALNVISINRLHERLCKQSCLQESIYRTAHSACRRKFCNRRAFA